MHSFTSIISLLIAAAAFLLSYRIFVRQKTFDNENQFFVYKLEQYNKIIRKAVNLQELYYDTFLWLKTEIQQKTLDDVELNEKADKVDKNTTDFRVILMKNSVFLPNDILQKLDIYYEQLYDESERIDSASLTSDLADKGIQRLNKLENGLQDIIDLVRQDLGIEIIDNRLKTRIGKDKKLIGTAPS